MDSLIVYIGSFKFPLGDAVAKRAYGLGKCLNQAGYAVRFIGEDKDTPIGAISEDKLYEGFYYCNIHKPNSSIEHFKYKTDIKLIQQKLKKWEEKTKIVAVIFCGTKCSLFANDLVNMCKNMSIPVIADSMDWLKIHTGNWMFDFVKQTDITFEICKVNKKAQGIITISEFLENYYSRGGVSTIVIPPLSPYDQCTHVRKKDIDVLEKLNIIYAGIPCRLGKPLKKMEDAKDRLDIAMQLLYWAYKDKYDFVFYIYGLQVDQYITIFPAQKDMVEEMLQHKIIQFMGYQEEKVVEEAVKNADYTLLLRNKNRTSMAGFPTKIAESIVLGTPVITTDTSDIKKYVIEGRDGFFVDIACLQDAKKKIEGILENGKKGSEDMKMNMKKNVAFLPNTYAKELKRFICGVVRNEN